MKKDAIVEIGKGNLHGAGQEGILPSGLHITTAKEWNDLLSKMNVINEVSSRFTETVIDFSKFDVIAVFDSVKTSGGHSLELDVKLKKNVTQVKAIKTGPKGMAASVMTQPFSIVKVPKRDVLVLFSGD